MESQTQNSVFRNNPEYFHPCIQGEISTISKKKDPNKMAYQS